MIFSAVLSGIPALSQSWATAEDGTLVARYPYVASRAGWYTRVIVLCVDPHREHSFTFIGKGETGKTVAVVENQIQSMGSYSPYIYRKNYLSLFTEEVQEEIYSIDIYSKTALPGQIVTYVQYTDTKGTLQSSMRIDGLSLFHRLPIEWIVTGLSGWYTGVNLQNYSDQIIDVYFRKQDGQFVQLEGPKFDLSEPNSSRAFLFAELLSGSPIGSGEFRSFAAGSDLDSVNQQVNGEPVDALSGLTVFANTSEHGMSEGIPAIGAFADGSDQFGSRFYLPMRSIEEIHDDAIQEIISAKYPYYGFALQNTNPFRISALLTHFSPDGSQLGDTILFLEAEENIGYTWNGLREELGLTEDSLTFKPEVGGHIKIDLVGGVQSAFGTAMVSDGEGQFAIVTGEKALCERDEGFRLAGFYLENRSESSLIQLVNTSTDTTEIEIAFYSTNGSKWLNVRETIPGHGLHSFNLQDLPDWPPNSGRNGIVLIESNTSPVVAIQHDYSRNMGIDKTKVSGKRMTPVTGGGALYATDPIVGNLRIVPSGTFLQGSHWREFCNYTDENQFTHVLTQDLAVMETEVTRQMWKDLRAAQDTLPMDPSDTTYGATLNHPVQKATWYEAILFSNLLSLENGFTQCYYLDEALTQPVNSSKYKTDEVYVNWDADGFRLPTEGEWEYFARAGTTSPFSITVPDYSSGNCRSCSSSDLSNLQSVGWYCANAETTSHPVGEKGANPWGLKDVHGNVSEWCWDWYGVYPEGNGTDHRGAASGLYRVKRGGNWIDIPRYLRSAHRSADWPKTRSFYYGFRLIRTVK
jgi:formylglycine-generating enzyme required for sulfatase activity